MSSVMTVGKSLRLADGFSYARLALKISSAAFVILGLFTLFSFPFKAQPRSGGSELTFSEGNAASNFGSAPAVDFSSHGLFYYPKTEVAAAGPGLDDMLRPYHLVGIIQGDKPEALIKNDLNQQTYFARAGENFDKFRVAEILTNSINVEFENHSKEIYLEEGIS